MLPEYWLPLSISPPEFNLQATLNSGQAFRWLFCSKSNEWRGVVNGKLWRLRQTSSDEPVLFCSANHCTDENPVDLIEYFRLSVNLSTLIHTWTLLDPLFASHSETLGIRLLKQDPVETLFAFITSANNNIGRISKLLNALCEEFGLPLRNGPALHRTFPTLHALARPGIEQRLRNIGFGYRAKFIPEAAKLILERGGEKRLLDLRETSTNEARAFLLGLPGVGNKVADCICLYALNKFDVVPVDVHILRAAYERGIIAINRSGHITDKIYHLISTALTDLWGEWAGWAQAIEFGTRIRKHPVHRGRFR